MSLRSIRLREAWNWGGLSARELGVRTYRAMDRHDTLNQAAVIAFFAMLSLVPLLSLTLSLALKARTGVANELEDVCRPMMPPEALKIVHDQINKLQNDNPVGLLSLSIVLLLWSASSLFVAVMDTTNAAYGVRDDRPWWKRRVMAIVLTVIETILLIGATVSIALWPDVAGWMHLGGAATVVQWLVVVVALLTAFALAYYFGPQVEQEWEWITPGATLGVLALIAASLGFRLYLHFGPSYSETYGALAGVVLMMLWMYLAALALLVGAEINCVIEHAAPHGRCRGRNEVFRSLRRKRGLVPRLRRRLRIIGPSPLRSIRAILSLTKYRRPLHLGEETPPMSVRNWLPLFFLTLSLAPVRPLSADDEKAKAIPGIGPTGNIVKLHTGFKFTEGPAADRAGNVYFSDIPNQRIHKVEPRASSRSSARSPITPTA